MWHRLFRIDEDSEGRQTGGIGQRDQSLIASVIRTLLKVHCKFAMPPPLFCIDLELNNFFLRLIYKGGMSEHILISATSLASRRVLTGICSCDEILPR
jgi:hypothetical protein